MLGVCHWESASRFHFTVLILHCSSYVVWLSSFPCLYPLMFLCLSLNFLFMFLWTYSGKSCFTSDSIIVRCFHSLFSYIQEVIPFHFFWKYVMPYHFEIIIHFEVVIVNSCIYLNVDTELLKFYLWSWIIKWASVLRLVLHWVAFSRLVFFIHFNSCISIEILILGLQMDQWLRTLAVLAEDLSPVPSTQVCMYVYGYPETRRRYQILWNWSYAACDPPDMGAAGT